MADTELAPQQQYLSNLRAELKAWEKAFAQANNGRKATREEIKADPIISVKYKEYSRLKNVSVPELSQHSITSPVKRKATAPQSTPRKKSRFTEHLEDDIKTPKKGTDDLVSSPAATRMFVDPTPQKDGRVLGLFDGLSPQSESKQSPSKGASKQRMALGDVDINCLATPSKTHKHPPATSTPQSVSFRHSRTPQSHSKQAWLDQFVTPSKRKAPAASAASIVSPPKDQLSSSTPAFLRRDSQRLPLSALVEDEEEEEAITPSAGKKRKLSIAMPLRKPGFRTFGRSLSTMISDMRKAEDEEHDEELDVLREMENEGTVKINVQDSQAALQRLGPDQEDVSEEETDTKAGQTGRIWKKRGQKRQTRRVVLKPTLKKPTSAEAAPISSPGEATAELVHETQVKDFATGLDGPPDGANEDSSDGDSAYEGGEADEHATSPIKRRKLQDGKGEAQEGIVKKAVKKVNALAHANFRRLKIRSKNTSGKSRFGRRR